MAKKFSLFYSWQSDLPTCTNRQFIESAIQEATAGMSSCDLQHSIDRDTKGVPGAPNISQTVMDKIENSDAFVADISLVTGLAKVDERPSPNPNVLIELGYAIALLGWDRIVLVYNKINGDGESLPFDIRQHRRIEYDLSEGGNEDEECEKLVGELKPCLDELLRNGKRHVGQRQPSLSISWSQIDIKKEKKKFVDIEELHLHRMIDIQSKIEQEMKDIEKIDGSMDPDWSKKKENFLNKAQDFLQWLSLANSTSKQDCIIKNNKEALSHFTLRVGNDGNATATNIRVEVSAPEWLLALDELPNEKDVPLRPEFPFPAPADLSRIYAPALRLARAMNPSLRKRLDFATGQAFFTGRLNRRIVGKRSSTCHVKGKKIVFWADELLHQHTRINEYDVLYMLALPDAPLGRHALEASVFCSEFEGWQDIDLFLNITG